MEKTSIKRLGYGFSALVMSISAVNFMPAFSNAAYATREVTPSKVLIDDMGDIEVGDTEIYLSGDITIQEQLAVDDDLVINLDGKSVALGDAAIAFNVAAGKKLTIRGQGDLSSFKKLSELKAGDGDLVLEGGTYGVDVKDFVGNGYAAYETADGKWEVATKNANFGVTQTVEGGKEFTTSFVNTDESVIKYEGTSFKSAVAKLGKVEQEGFSFNLETGEVTVADSVAAGKYTITVTDNANTSYNSTLTIYLLGEVTAQSAQVSAPLTLDKNVIFKDSASLPAVTYEVVDTENSSIANKTKFTATKTGNFKVKYTLADTAKTTGEFDITVSPADNAYDATIFQNLEEECGDKCIIATDPNLEVKLDEESNADAAQYVGLSQDNEEDLSELTVTLKEPFYSKGTDQVTFLVGDSTNTLTLYTYRAAKSIDLEAGKTINLADLYSVYGDFLTKATSDNGTFVYGITESNTITGANAKTEGAYYKAGAEAGEETITWTFAGKKHTDTTKVNVYKVAENKIENQYFSIDDITTDALVNLYTPAGSNSELTLYIDGAVVDEDYEFSVGRHELKYVEKVGDKVVSDDATAYLYVTGIEVPEAQDIEVGEEVEIDLTNSGEIAYGLDLANIEAVNTAGLKVSETDGKYTVSADEAKTYSLTFTTKEKTAEDTYNGNGTYTFTFNVKSAEEEPVKTASLAVEESATTAKVGETVTFTVTAEAAKEGDEVTVKVDDGEPEVVESDIYTFTAEEAGEHTFTFSLEGAEDVVKTVTVEAEEEPVEYTLEVEADKNESDEVKIDEEIVFSWTSNGTLLVSIDGGEAEEDTESAENDGGEFIAKFATAGEHTVTVSLKEDASQTKTFTFNVVEDEPEEKTASLDVEESATTAKVGETVTFTITAEPAAEGDKVTVKVNDGEAEEVEGDTYTFTAEKAGEYTFVFALDGAEEVTKTVTVEAEEEPTPADPRPEDLEVKNDTILVSLDQVNGKTFSVDTDYEIEVIECQTAEENCEGLEIKIAEDGKSYTIDSLANAGEYTLNFYHEFDEGKTLVATTTVVVYDIEEDTSENANETLNAIVAGLESVIAETAGEESTIEGLVEKLNALENVDELLGKVAGESREDKLTALAAIVDKISNGETLTTEVTGTDQALEDSEVDAEAKDSILEKLSAEGINYDGISYYDIDVIVKDENGTELASLSELDNKVTIAIAVGEDPEGTSRSYYVVRFHDGVAEIIAEGLEATDGMITFASDKFSTYAVAYTEEDTTTPTDPTEPTDSTDTESTTDSTSGKKGKKTVKTPDTGVATAGISSATASAIISGLATASLIALVGAVKFAKRNK